MAAIHFSLLNGQTAEVTLTDTLWSSILLSLPLCPAPTIDSDSGDLIFQNTMALEQPLDVIPEKTIQSFTGKARDQRILAISLFPARYSLKYQLLHVLKYARIHVRMTMTDQALLRPVISLKQNTAMQPIVKIYFVDEGPYVITGSDLASAGISLESIIPQNCQLFNGGVEQPLAMEDGGDGRFDANDRLLFYGRFRHGNDEYFNAYSDTNVFVLAAGSTSSARFVNTTIEPSAHPTSDTFTDTLHLEKDLAYYAGDSDNDIHNSELVSGEGWIWSLLNKNSNVTISFDLPTPASTQDSILLRIRLRGTTLDSHSPDHHIKISLNGTQVYETWFDDRNEFLVEARCKASLFRESGNNLTLDLLSDTPSERSQIYMDWFEISYLRSLVANKDWLNFATPSAEDKSVFITGFVDSSLTAWDMQRKRSYLLPRVTRQWRDYLSVQSYGYYDGNAAKLTRDGKDIAYGNRGHNLWRIDPNNGQLLESKRFDTYESSAQSDSMSAWIGRLPEGAVVAVAIRDEGTVSMTEAAYLALESLGSALTRKVETRDSWALIGCKGAAPGTVPEKLSKSKSGPAIAASSLLFPEGGSSFSEAVKFPADAGSEIVQFSEKALKHPARIVQYRQSDLVSGGSGADFIIITHPLFKSQADELANYRASHNGWRTKVVLLDDIYDEFSYSLAEPLAIRTFLQQTQQKWIKPSPKFVLLFGDASWDPKNHLNVLNPTEFVPTYGNPVSDSWFGCLDGEGDILPDVNIGRIPVKNVAEAEASIEKIKAYESSPSALWKKSFLFISGGFDFLEQSQFGQQSSILRNQYVFPAPTFGSAVTLNKSTGGYVEGEHRQEMLDTMNDGVCWVNFIGHAGSRTWDLMFHDVDIEALDNSPRFPFITSMTCHTGRFAEPNQVAFGEHFLTAENKGAIGFMGTSGWGYSYEDYSFLCKIFPAALSDTMRYLSEIINVAKVRLWENAAENVQIRDMMYQYNLLGDPAIKLATPVKPDLALQSSDIQLIPETPSLADSVARLKVVLHNYGLGANDSIGVKIVAKHPDFGEQVITSVSKLSGFGRTDSLECIWQLHGMTGAVNLVVQLDPENRIQEEDENNNIAMRPFTILSSQIQILAPSPFSLMPAANVIVKLDGSNLVPGSAAVYRVQVDTSSSFTGVISESYVLSDWSSAPVFDWKPATLKENQQYFLRINDSTHNPAYWNVSSFKTALRNETGWRQEGQFDLSKSAAFHISCSKNATLANLSFPLYAESAGYFDGNFARIIVGDSPALQPHRGHNIVVVDPESFAIEATRTFDTYEDSSAANSMASMIEQLPKGKIVLAAIMDEGTVSMTSRAYRALESIGSAQCRSVGARSSWAIIGRKGAALGSVPEKTVLPKAGSAVVADTLQYFAPVGTLTSPRIGPAAAWRSVRAEAEVPQTGDLTLSLLGQRRNSSVWDTLRTGLAANRDHDIAAISARSYPYLQLCARFSSRDQQHSPRLSAWQVLHDPVPDLAVSPAFLSLSADSVLAGRPVVLNLGVFNIGLAAADSVSLTFSETAPGSGERLFSRVMLPKPLAADQSLTIDQLYTPGGKPGSRLLTIRIDGDNTINELSESNNTLTTRVQVVADTLKPEIAVTFDGRTLAAGDWVAAQPVILARLIDDSPLALSDTLRVNLLLDGERVPFSTPMLQLLPPPDTTAAALLKFMPQLHDGEHRLEILFADGSGNLAATAVEFGVAATIRLERVMNYPNPLRESTDFTFELTQAAEVRIRIYTVNGRLIRTLEGGTLGAGFNRLFWDGRDGDGDLLANGVYLYRVDAVSGSERTQVLEKCIVMR